MAVEEKPEEKAKVKIQFKGGVTDNRSGAHGLYRWSFKGKGPFEVFKADYEKHLERTGLFEPAPEKQTPPPPPPPPPNQGGGDKQS